MGYQYNTPPLKGLSLFCSCLLDIAYLIFVFFFVFLFLFHVASSFNLEDNQKRWVVIRITLNRLLLPVLRDFAGQELAKHYTSLKSSSGIDTQIYHTHMRKDGSFDLNYGSINNNWGIRDRKVYDYEVASAEDLAKLYLQPHMAKFTGE